MGACALVHYSTPEFQPPDPSRVDALADCPDTDPVHHARVRRHPQRRHSDWKCTITLGAVAIGLTRCITTHPCARASLLSKVVTWGRVDAGGDSSAVQTQLTGVREHLQSRAEGCAD